MIDQRFSAEAFARLGPNTFPADDLCHELAGEIREEIRAAFEAVAFRVVEQLRSLGHDLYERPQDPAARRSNLWISFGPANPRPTEGVLMLHLEAWLCVGYLGNASEWPLEANNSGPDSEEELPF